MSTPNKIYAGDVRRNEPEQLERKPSVAVKSGMLVVVTGAAPGTFIPHANAGVSPGMHYVCKEPILGPVDYTYTLTAPVDTAFAYIAHSGELYNMRAVAATYAYDQAMASNGDGTLKAANGTTDIVVCYCDEVVTTTTAAPFMRVKFR